MALVPGTRLGPYEVVDLLGAGGMGEVYRAKDPRLGREVAIKVLPEQVAGDTARLALFEREARSVAALNHPNILTVYDVGTSNGVPYVVTELLEGETLRALVSRRTPTVQQILTYGLQAARGLEAAHARGIVHRDVKPENLFLTTEGRVKVLDFGLAKLAHPTEDLGSQLSTAARSSASGQVAGTVLYMSPEQARAQALDVRSDVFSFGVVLHELLAGKHPFRKDTMAGTLTAIVEETPPDLENVSRAIPPAIGGIVRRCLHKAREERYASGHDVTVALEAVLAAPSGAAALREVEERSPYPGLSSFTEKDAPVFFGREQEVEELWGRIQQRKLLAVIGPSGAGKTSFVRAGVVAHRPPGWAALVMTPAAQSLRGLGRALGPELAGDPEALGMLADVEEPGTAVELVRRWKRPEGQGLLIVDQFEELFTLNPPEVQERFAALLGRLGAEAEVHVLLSLRDDFLIRCHELPPLARVFEHLTPLLPLPGADLRRAIEEPAKKQGYRFEDETLVDEMVESVEGARAALPLLAFAVSRLWEKRDPEKKVLTRAAYEAVGGVAGALAQHAEATMDRIGSERQAVVREIFRNLVTAQGTRAVIDREELLSAFPDRETAAEVLTQLVEARLLTAYEVEGQDSEPSHQRIEVVHESLLKAWPRLVRWQTQDEDGAQLRDQLKQAAHLWEEKARSPDVLWSGTAYREFELWRERYAGKLTVLEGEYAQAMLDRVRRHRRLRRIAAASIVLASLGVAAVLGVMGQREARARAHAEAEALRAEASKLVALGKLDLAAEPTASLAYARKSLETYDTPEARRLAVEALWRGPTARIMPVPSPAQCTSLAASPDGSWLACGNWDDVVGLFGEDGRTVHHLTGSRNAARVKGVRFSDDGQKLASWAQGDPEIVVWDTDGRRLRDLRPGGFPRWFSDGQLISYQFTPGQPGLEIAAQRIDGSRAETVLRWDFREGRLQDVSPTLDAILFSKDRTLYLRSFLDTPESGVDTPIGTHRAEIFNAEFQDGTRNVVSIDVEEAIRVWSGRTLELVHTRQGLDPDRLVQLPVLDRSGVRLASHSMRERASVVWDLAGPPDAEPLLLRWRALAMDAGVSVFLGEGRWLAVAGGTSVAFWPVEMPHPRVLRRHTSSIEEVGFALDGRHLVSCATREARIWPLAPGSAPGHPIVWESGYTCYSATFDPAGEQVLVAATANAAFLASIDGSGHQTLVRVPPTESIGSTALDPAGRWAVVAANYSPDVKDRQLHVVDRGTGEVRHFPLPGATAALPNTGGVLSLRFVGPNRLVSAGQGGVRIWDLATGESEPVHSGPWCQVDASRDGRLLVVVCHQGPPGPVSEATRGSDELLTIDLETGASRPILTHGRDITSVAIADSGSTIATGGSTGEVRIGPFDGGEPHLLLGAGGYVVSIDFSPDGRWIASSAGSDIWLWPSPDVSKPPLHALPLDELLAKLDPLTNLRVVEDETSPTGYRTEIGPFPGWQDVPTW